MCLPAIAYWVHHFDQFLVRFGDNLGIRYYGLSYVVGFLIALFMLVVYARKKFSRLPEADVSDLSTYLVIGVVVGGRVGYFLLYEAWRNLAEDPMAILRVWDGGMSFHGGITGVGVALWFFARRHKQSYPHLVDLISSVAPAGLFFGRLANFINGELWGKASSVSWAVIFPQSAPPDYPLALIPPRHPSQLYEAALEGLVLFAWTQWRVWGGKVLDKGEGRITAEFLIGYAAARSFCEVFREPDAGIAFIFGLSRGTFYSLLMIAVAAGFWIYSRRTVKAG